MANIASAKKRIRSTNRKTIVNKNRISKIRTFEKKVTFSNIFTVVVHGDALALPTYQLLGLSGYRVMRYPCG